MFAQVEYRAEDRRAVIRNDTEVATSRHCSQNYSGLVPFEKILANWTTLDADALLHHHLIGKSQTIAIVNESLL
jgi:hypothetical protein